jgi:hypothetical protein
MQSIYSVLRVLFSRFYIVTVLLIYFSGIGCKRNSMDTNLRSTESDTTLSRTVPYSNLPTVSIYSFLLHYFHIFRSPHSFHNIPVSHRIHIYLTMHVTVGKTKSIRTDSTTKPASNIRTRKRYVKRLILFLVLWFMFFFLSYSWFQS